MIFWNGKTSLTLSAFHDIAINSNISNLGGGAVTLRADNTGTGVGTVAFAHIATVSCSRRISTSGPVSIFYNPGSYTGPDSSSLFVNPYSKNVTGGGQLTAYMLVNTVTDLQNVGTNLNGIYALGRNIDASTVTNFKPIGSFAGPGFAHFNGIFDGQFVKGSGPAISNLTIAPTQDGLNHLGLFAFNAGTIRNLHLSNVSVTANPHGSDGQQIQIPSHRHGRGREWRPHQERHRGRRELRQRRHAQRHHRGRSGRPEHRSVHRPPRRPDLRARQDQECVRRRLGHDRRRCCL